jgi:hypothetical protein
VAKKVYALSFGIKGVSESSSKRSKEGLPGGSEWEVEGKIWFDFKRDVL